MTGILQTLSTYRLLFLIAAQILLLIMVIIIVHSLYNRWKDMRMDRERRGDKYHIRADFSGDIDETSRQNTIRQIMAPDGIDPSPNSYLTISDGGKELYVRSVTIAEMSQKVKYAYTFEDLFHFPNSTYTVFIYPLDKETTSRKIDKQLNVLESEEIVNEGNTNKVRKLRNQSRKTTRWADEVDAGDKKFFNVGFLFTFVAESIEKLNDITDEFRGLALNKKIYISNCFGAQAEAFLSSLPLNRKHGALIKNVASDCINLIMMDEDSLSTILNYTTDHFSHKHGIPLARNYFTGLPFVFDPFDKSHDGFSMVVTGKTHSGKTTFFKLLIERGVLLGWRFVIIDSQTRKGTSEGEYSSCTEINGGVNYQISSKENNIINLFEVQESTELIKEGFEKGREVRTLDLNSAITDIVYSLRTLIRGNMQKNESGEKDMDSLLDSDINDILTRITKELFAERGIYHGDADSLYEEGTVIVGGALQAGMVPKKLPIITDAYKKIIIEKAINKEPELDSAYRYILNNLRENVRELYYTESGKFFTKSQFQALPENPERKGEKLYLNETVKELHGIRPYYDGQSTFSISCTCPVTNIDISQLTEIERRSARNVALHLVDSSFVQKNSEIVGYADKLLVIIDEAHESFKDLFARILLAGEVRTGRKRNVGIITGTQTTEEYFRYPETEDILSQAAVKVLFKQTINDSAKFAEVMKLTEPQMGLIQNRLGVVTDKDDPAAASRHRGEACIIDGEQVQFIKVDYMKNSEGLSVETDASTVIKMMRGEGADYVERKKA